MALVLVFLTTRPQSRRFAPGSCGPTSLYALCRQLGISVRFDDLLARFGDQKEEADFVQIQQVAATLNVSLEAREMTPETLKQLHAPGILHLDGNHFVAALDYTECGVRIADPINGGKSCVSIWTYPELCAHWDGRILILKAASAQNRF